MVEMWKNRKKRAVLFISVGVFSPTICGPVLVGEDGKTLVGEKSPTSPAFGSGWDARFIRVN